MATGLARTSCFTCCATGGIGAPTLLGEGVLGGVAFLVGPPPSTMLLSLLCWPAALGGTDGAGIGLTAGGGTALEGDLD